MDEYVQVKRLVMLGGWDESTEFLAYPKLTVWVRQVMASFFGMGQMMKNQWLVDRMRHRICKHMGVS